MGISPKQTLWNYCITGCFMELWKTLFAGCGKAGLYFSMYCEQSSIVK